MARQRQILEGTRWIPSDTSADVWEEDYLRSYQSGWRDLSSRPLTARSADRAIDASSPPANVRRERRSCGRCDRLTRDT
jgi:hypothetical protein